MDKYIDQITSMAIEYAPKLLLAILTLWIGFMIIGWITSAANKMMSKNKVDVSLSKFLTSLISVGLKVMLLVSVAGMFGVETAAFVGVIAAMAFAIGMALQGSLAHFASGVMILVFKPYKVGDLVELGGNTGVVESIEIFNTILLTPDNRKIIMPNATVTSNPITNISGQGEIRVDMAFGIGYSDDIDKARKIMHEVAQSCPQVLKDKPVDIFVSELADSSVNFVVRPWCKSEHFWDVNFYMHEHIKKQLDANNVSIPFPQMDIHLQGNEKS
ncbi:MAG: mechanosensitive ion channel family protein [Saprospiraceae bacterium]